MSKLYLKRFANWDLYQNTEIPDGTFFVIVDSGQLGVRKGDVDILTPPKTLKDYKLPDGDLVITQNDTISQAIAKLEKQIMNYADTSAEAINTANDAIVAVRNLEYTGEDNPDHEARLVQLESKIILMSESEFEAQQTDGLDPNKVYYIYDND